MLSAPPLISFQTVPAGSSASRDWSTNATCTVSPSLSVPTSGCSSPTIIRNSVVLPAPFGPITPTIPAGGSEKLSLSNSSLSPKPFATPSSSITTSPRRLLLGEQLLVRTEARLRLRVPRARAHPHPFELARERAPPRRLLLLLRR